MYTFWRLLSRRDVYTDSASCIMQLSTVQAMSPMAERNGQILCVSTCLPSDYLRCLLRPQMSGKALLDGVLLVYTEAMYHDLIWYAWRGWGNISCCIKITNQ